MNATASFKTTHADRYLAALCTHFAAKVPARQTGRCGHITLPFGICDLTADDDGLAMAAKAKDALSLARVVEVMTRHVERFAFRENPHLDWTLPAHPQPDHLSDDG